MPLALQASTSIERESKEVRPFFVRSLDDDGELVDVTAATVEVGFARGLGRPTVWTAATWATGGPFETAFGQAWAADALIGGTGTGADRELAVGKWNAFVRVDTGTERPVIPAGVLTVL